MHIRAIPADALTPDQIALWSEAQQNNPLLDSPYFRPEFTRAVSAVRRGVEVAVLETAGIPVGYFPFQRALRGTGRPVGAPLSDFQALISRDELVCDPSELLRACRLSAWHFDHLLTSQTCFGQFARRRVESPYVDLSDGFAAYASRLRHRYKYVVAPQRKLRCLEREHGPLRFEPHVADRSILATLFRWKSDQYRRTCAKHFRLVLDTATAGKATRISCDELLAHAVGVVRRPASCGNPLRFALGDRAAQLVPHV